MSVGDVNSGFEIGDAAGVLAAVLEHTVVAIKMLDLDGRVLSWNPGCEHLHGWKAEEVLGSVLPHVPADQRPAALDFIRSVAHSGVISQHAVVSLNADGWRQNIVLTAIPVTDTEGHIAAVLTIARDALSSERGDSVGDEVSALMGRMFGEPLGAIANAATLLARPEVASDVAQRTRLVGRIAELSRDARDLLDDLRISAGDADGLVIHERELVDLGVLASEVAARVGSSSERVLVDFAVGVALVEADRVRLARALDVMLRGAIAGARNGSRIHLSVGKSGPAAFVEIRYRGTVVDAGLSRSLGEAAEAGRRGRGAASVWSGFRYVRGVAHAHGGQAAVSSGRSGEAVVTLMLPSGSGRHRMEVDLGDRAR